MLDKHAIKEEAVLLPFWVYLVVIGIVFSAYMTIRATREEREIELKQIEQDGEIYMERLQEEREKRKEYTQGA